MFQSQKKFFQWHREGFTVPQSCEILAKGDLFREQAFRYKNALAIQFHDTRQRNFIFKREIK